jgi:hypothetical protein
LKGQIMRVSRGGVMISHDKRLPSPVILEDSFNCANARLPHDVGRRAFHATRWQARNYSRSRRRSRVLKTPIDLRPR